MVRLFPALISGLLLAACPLWAQTTSAPDNWLAQPPANARLEGTITMRSGGVTSVAQLRFQAPDRLRLDIEANPAALIAAHTLVAGGDETLLYDSGTHRLHRLPYNITRAWWQGRALEHGGPANAVLFGWGGAALQRQYMSTRGKGATAGTATLRLDARADIGRRYIRDSVVFGGMGTSAFYAAFKRKLWDRPGRITLTFDATGKVLQVRDEVFEGEGQSFRSEIKLDAAGLPASTITRDAAGGVVSEFQYAVKPAAEEFAADTFTLPAPAEEQIAEDDEPRGAADYEAGADAASQYNRGVALARFAEDYPGALTAWEGAMRIKANAVAPHFAAYEAARLARDPGRANVALEALEKLLGETHFEVLLRKADRAALQRDWAQSKTWLEAAHKARPDDLSIALLLADLARGQNDIAGARNLLLSLLTTASPDADNIARAAEMLVETADRADAEKLLDGLPRDTEGQRLARELLLLAIDKATAAPEFETPAARMALALAQQRAGRTAEALATWESLRNAPAPVATMARRHLVLLNAVRGALPESLQALRDLFKITPAEGAEVDDVRDLLLGSWQKAFRQGQLKSLLQQYSLSTNAEEEDWRLWAAFQEAYGTPEEFESILVAGVERFPRSAWWHSRRAEGLMLKAGDPKLVKSQEALMRSALREAQLAISSAPEQPYYQIQRALLLTQYATWSNGVEDERRVQSLKVANDNLTKLEKDWPDDKDVRISVTLQRMSLDPSRATNGYVQELQRTLQLGAGYDDKDHEAASAARQAMASALRRGGKTIDAAQQYFLLLSFVQSADEELGIARNYLLLLPPRKEPTAEQNQADAELVVPLLMRLAHESWEFADAHTLLNSFTELLLDRPALALQIGALLQANNDPYARIAEAHLRQALLRHAAMLANVADAPPRTEAELRAAQQKWDAAVKALEPLTDNGDHVLASRAAGLLADDALLRKDLPSAIKWLQAALKYEPRDFNMRLALTIALLNSDRKDEALTQRRLLLTALPRNAAAVRRIAALSAQMGLPDEARTLALRAYNEVQNSPDYLPRELPAFALTAARTVFASGQTPRAAQIYNDLAGEQWEFGVRVAALVDMERLWRAVGDNEKAGQARRRLADMKATVEDAKAAELMLRELD